jgi:hypothetical protein
MHKVVEEPWFTNPFEWYEQEEEKFTISLPLTETKALDLLAGLHDIYLGFKRNNKEEAIADLNALATILIAHTLGYSEEVVEELLVIRANNNMDDFLAEVLKEGE